MGDLQALLFHMELNEQSRTSAGIPQHGYTIPRAGIIPLEWTIEPEFNACCHLKYSHCNVVIGNVYSVILG